MRMEEGEGRGGLNIKGKEGDKREEEKEGLRTPLLILPHFSAKPDQNVMRSQFQHSSKL